MTAAPINIDNIYRYPFGIKLKIIYDLRDNTADIGTFLLSPPPPPPVIATGTWTNLIKFWLILQHIGCPIECVNAIAFSYILKEQVFVQFQLMISSFSQEQFQQFYKFSGGGGGNNRKVPRYSLVLGDFHCCQIDTCLITVYRKP